MRNRTAPSDVFDSTKSSLKSLLEQIAEGLLKLPNFQRDWKWEDEHIVSLIASVAESHPIGAAMVIETGGAFEFDSRCVEGSRGPRTENIQPQLLILDGQQRLTSLYQACFTDGPVIIKSGKKTAYRYYFIDMEKAVDADIPLEESIISVVTNASGTKIKAHPLNLLDPEIQYLHKIYPLSMIFRIDEWEQGFSDFWDERPKDERRNASGVLREFRKAIEAPFTSCMMPIITLKRGIALEGICRVYEKLNSKGVRLDSFDLLIAHYAARKHNLREDWHGSETDSGIYSRLRQASKGLLEDLTPKSFMQAVSMVKSLDEGKANLATSRSDVLAISLDDYLKYKSRVERSFVAAAKQLIKWGIHMKRDVPTLTLVTALAVVLSSLSRNSDDVRILEKVKNWFWCALYGQHYASGTDKALSIDVPDVINWLLNDDRTPRSVAKARVLLSDIDEASRRTAKTFHSAIATSIVRNGALDFLSGESLRHHVYSDDNYDMHHIFPVKYCREIGIPEERIDSVVNKTPMSMRANRHMGGCSPSEYVATLERVANLKPEQMDEILASHGIDGEALRANDFNRFYETRLAALGSFIEADMGKPLVHDADEPEEEEDDDVADSGHGVPDNCDWHMTARSSVVFLAARGSQFVVLPGSIMSKDANPSLREADYRARDQLIREGSVRLRADGRYETTGEIPATSPSAAATVFSGMKACSNKWRNREGKLEFPSIAEPGPLRLV